MARKGPVTKDTSSIVLGLAQVRIGVSAANITTLTRVLLAANSIGALANTKFTGSVDWWKLESGFPLLEDYQVPLREAAHLECAFKEISPMNMALAYGKDITVAPYSAYTAHSGELPLGTRDASAFIRMEALYTYPNGTNFMTILFPRGQVSAAVEMDLAAEDAAAVPITIESKRADSETSGGNAAWDSRPLGRIFWE